MQHYRVSPHGFVDAKPARRHVDALRQAGYTWAALAELTGLSEPAVRKVGKWTGQATCTLDTRNRILSVPVPEQRVTGRGRVPAIGTARRVQALMVLGWSQEALAGELGFRDQRAVSWLIHRRTWVTAETAAKVAAAFDRLQWTVGPSGRAASRAKTRGWFPPAAWDDIDDPDETPTLGEKAVVRFPERYRELRDHCGMSLQDIAEHMQIDTESLKQQLRRYRMTERTA